ncbi:hypothetical protein EHO60_10430 [Leptospira fletcheri]|uniref:Uncharacterized protein n=1 Tax=Leptospira fletcheri TaxID=2484981 RepID=A0A4R9GEE5_9LEPT|nr:hypothetical protein [Leptospira fletcheri]TGK10250.1 hypothetical protein EHO60_10430 [Leptospira fletcheri]
MSGSFINERPFRGRFSFLLLPILFFASSYPTGAKDVLLDFIYVDANTGQSSGGHSALRFQDTVYHFQYYPDEIFRIVREPYENFSYSYNTYSNRTSRIVSLSLPESGLEKIRDGLERYSLQQFKHLNNLEGLRSDSDFFRGLHSPDPKVSIPSLGYFGEESGLEDVSSVHGFLRERLGADWLGKTRSRLKQELFEAVEQGRFSDFPDLPPTTRREYPFFKGGPAKWFLSRLSKLAFLETLEKRKVLSKETIFSPASYHINELEKSKLSILRNDLMNSLSASLEEDPSDWGPSALVSLARILAMEESLRSGRLVFLITFPQGSDSVPFDRLAEQKETTDRASGELFAASTEYRKSLNAASEWNEEKYRTWEDLENRAFELRTGLARGISVRNTFEILHPSLPAVIPYSFPLPPREKLSFWLDLSDKREKEYYNNLKILYDFRLIRRNCTTEIFDSFDDILNEKEYELWLGRKIDPRTSLAFIPFAAYDKIKADWKPMSEETVLSFRKRKLESMRKAESSWKVSLRESNTRTSTIYESNEEDSDFLFFTDDVIWIRPVYGLINLGFGLGNGFVGIFTLPFDRGARVKSGLQSAFFSLPELIFFNIRKGSFPKASPRESQESSNGEKSVGP